MSFVSPHPIHLSMTGRHTPTARDSRLSHPRSLHCHTSARHGAKYRQNRYAVGGPWGATQVDVAGSFAAAAHAAGIRPGYYYSLGSNSYVAGLTPALTPAQYLDLVLAHLAELWDPARHGSLFEVWFDGGFRGFGKNVSELLARLQPNAIAFNGCDPNPAYGCIGPPTGGNARWVGTEAGVAPDPCWSTGTAVGGGDPNSTVWNPAESDTTLQNGDNWFWDPGAGLRSLATLVEVYHRYAPVCTLCGGTAAWVGAGVGCSDSKRFPLSDIAGARYFSSVHPSPASRSPRWSKFTTGTPQSMRWKCGVGGCA